jgi:hypothetical protein
MTSISTSLEDRIINLLLQHFQPYAFTVRNSIVYITKDNVEYARQKIDEVFDSSHEIKVIGKGKNYVYQRPFD